MDKVEKFKHKIIAELKIYQSVLYIEFIDGTALRISDEGQDCCEHRYMHTDDELDYFVGSNFQGLTIEDGPLGYNEWNDVTETQFMKVETSKGVFTIVNYNEHNGYCGGFDIVIREIMP